VVNGGGTVIGFVLPRLVLILVLNHLDREVDVRHLEPDIAHFDSRHWLPILDRSQLDKKNMRPVVLITDDESRHDGAMSS
jgi:hypothetical protein